ncbi:FAD:protein FMN transferase [Rhodococcus rhodochrous]|uniref:FAD:protein FMN transferase n=1 Tax=Rhodococcus rhodochrous KG-21 TaxID=1441923 RepID=A0A0M8PGG4_RHORH|nr:FAD:protein FMN transferase [Rhodococcus rhodochrous]KOS55846.1 membrane protein [Rhodococcus rhodochrous KG-21]
MIRSSEWREWGVPVAVAVTEYAALVEAETRVRAAIAESEAACNPQRGDAEIHEVNLAQGIPVQVSPRLSALLRSALWAARMTDGTVSPLAADDAGIDEDATPPIHPLPDYSDIHLDGETVLAPFGVNLDITETARADTADQAAATVARSLECGVLVRMGDVTATAGHSPAGGWQVSVPGAGTVELPAGSAMATRMRNESDEEQNSENDVSGRWVQVTVIAEDALWADAAAAAALLRGAPAVRWLEQYDLAARLVDGGGRVHTTRRWSRPHAA